MAEISVPPLQAHKIFVMGAGASAADGAPLQGELFGHYHEILNREKSRHLKALIRPELKDFFANFWGIDIYDPTLQKHDFPTFEEALGLLEFANTRGDFFKGFGGLHDDAGQSQQIRAHLIHLIAIVLDEALRGAGQVNRDFVTRLKTLGWLEQSGFLSLNYDLFLDNALEEITGQIPKYTVNFCNMAEPQAPTGAPPSLLLKAHGSLNWLYCPTCGTIYLYPGAKIVSAIIYEPLQMNCSVCQSPRIPIVVPPTFYKAMSNFYLQQIWQEAEQTLRQADHLIFCGYSFPDADLHFKYMLKRAELNRPDNRPLEVFVVNEHPDKNESIRQEERQRYARFFRDKNLFHWTNLSFADLAVAPERYADPKSWV
jgi:NAD-dependent SIR2 family protein deacetylase